MKLSIITVCFNAERTIEKTIKSILGQTFTKYEWIVVDGKSTDRTNEIIKEVGIPKDIMEKVEEGVTIAGKGAAM